MQKLKDMKIKKRLNTGFKMVTGIATIAAVLGIIAMLVASGRYEYAMTRSEERRVGKECRIGCRSRWSPYH